MNDALVKNMDLLDEQAMHIHAAEMQKKLDIRIKRALDCTTQRELKCQSQHS
jgi:hypothetical protein